MKKIFVLLLITILLPTLIVAQMNQSVPHRPLVFRNVTLIDMKDKQPKLNATVVIYGNRITEIGKNIKTPKNSQVIDGSGKYLIPGLWDMHVHLFNNVSRIGTHNKEQNFPLLVANGITGVRDMFSDDEDIKLAQKWNAELAAGNSIGPRIFFGSRIVDGVPTFLPNTPGVLGVKNAEEARRAVRTLKAEGAGFSKLKFVIFGLPRSKLTGHSPEN
ncbi:MAG: amidohydrolase family protein [Aridibacter sp.]